MFLTDDPLSTRAEPAPHQAAAPARRGRGRRLRASRGSLSSHARGLTWVHLDAPTRRRGRAARRALRLASARPRGRPLEAPAAEDRRVPRVPLRGPPLPRLRQGDPAAERGRARRLPRPGLPDHAAERRAAAGHAPLRALRGRRGAAREPVLEGLRATCSTTSSTTSSTTASRSSTRSGTSSTRSRTRCSRAAPRRSSATSPT